MIEIRTTKKCEKCGKEEDDLLSMYFIHFATIDGVAEECNGKFIDVVWVGLESLKKEILKKNIDMIDIQAQAENNTASSVYEGYARAYKEILQLLDLCNSQEQKKFKDNPRTPKSDIADEHGRASVSCEHNTGEDGVMHQPVESLTTGSSPVQNPKKCTCPEYLKKLIFKNRKYINGKFVCGRCGGEL